MVRFSDAHNFERNIENFCFVPGFFAIRSRKAKFYKNSFVSKVKLLLSNGMLLSCAELKLKADVKQFVSASLRGVNDR